MAGSYRLVAFCAYVLAWIHRTGLGWVSRRLGRLDDTPVLFVEMARKAWMMRRTGNGGGIGIRICVCVIGKKRSQ